jgi:hypothetical protein
MGLTCSFGIGIETVMYVNICICLFETGSGIGSGNKIGIESWIEIGSEVGVRLNGLYELK